MEIQIISGFLGAGKTTFINKYIRALDKDKIAVLENEFGSIGLDGSLVSSDYVKEINSGCICCSLRGDFEEGIKEIYQSFAPDLLLIEPSGVGRLSDIIKASKGAIKNIDDAYLTKLIVLVDASTYFEFKEDFGPFFLDQIQNAGLIFLSQLDLCPSIEKLVEDLKAENPWAYIYREDFRNLDSSALLALVNDSIHLKNRILKNTKPPKDRVFTSLSKSGFTKASIKDLEDFLQGLSNEKYGNILRAKGTCKIANKLYHFDFTKRSTCIREEEKLLEPAIVVIGSNLEKILEDYINEGI